MSDKTEHVSDAVAASLRLMLEETGAHALQTPIRQILTTLAVGYCRSERFGEAIEAARKALQEHGDRPTDEDLLLALGLIFNLAKERDEALATYSQILRKNLAASERAKRAAANLLLSELCDGSSGRALLMLRRLAEYDADIPRRVVEAILAEPAYAEVQHASDFDLQLGLARLELESGHLMEGLAQIDRALPLALESTEKLEALHLKAQLLELTDAARDAAKEYVKAAATARVIEKDDLAVELLQKALELDPSLADARWELSDALRASSYGTTDPADALELVSAAREQWYRARDAAGIVLEPRTSWVFVNAALIYLRALELVPAGDRWWACAPGELLWAAISHLETSILLYADDPARWATLGRAYSWCQLEGSALQATARALELDPASEHVLQARAVALAKSGFTRQALEFVEQRNKVGLKDAWWEALEGFLLLDQRQYKAGRRLLASSLRTDATKTWATQSLAHAQLYLGNHRAAIRLFKRIRAAASKATAGELNIIADAAYWCGDFVAAARVAETALGDPLESACSLYLTIGLTHVAQRNWKEADYKLVLAAEAAASRSDLRAIVRDLRVAKQQYAARDDQAAIAVLTGAIPAVKRRREQLSAAIISTTRELENIIENERRNSSPSTTKMVGAQLGLARTLANEELERTAGIYEYLVESQRHLEAIVGIRQTAKQLMDVGDGFAREGVISVALERWNIAGRISKQLPADERFDGELAVRQAFAMCLSGEDFDAAELEFRRAISTFRADPGGDLGRICRRLLSNVRHYWRIDNLWRNMAEQASDTELIPCLKRACGELREFLVSHFGMDQEGYVARRGFLRSITVEISPEALPADAGSEWWFVRNATADIRRTIFERMGIETLGILVRGATRYAVPSGYSIFIYDVPVGFSILGSDREFLRTWSLDGSLPDFNDAPTSNPFRATHAGLLGYWTDHVHESQADVSRFKAASAHLEFALHRNLNRLVGPDEVQLLLRSWCSAHPQNQALREVSASDDKFWEFARLASALLTLGVPLTDGRRAAELYLESGGRRLNDLALQIRLELGTVARIPSANYRHVSLSESLHQRIADSLSMTPDGPVIVTTRQNLLSWVAEVRRLVRRPSMRRPTLLVVDRSIYHAAAELAFLANPNVPVRMQAELFGHHERRDP